LAVVIPTVVSKNIFILVAAIIIAIILYKKSLIAKAGISQGVELQSQDNLNPMNLKELKINNEGRHKLEPISKNEQNHSTMNFE